MQRVQTVQIDSDNSAKAAVQYRHIYTIQTYIYKTLWKTNTLTKTLHYTRAALTNNRLREYE